MTQEVLVELLAAGEATKGDVTFQIPLRMFQRGAKPSIVLQSLAGVETVEFFIGDGAGWTEVLDDQATPVAATLDFAGDKTSVTFNTPGLYSVTHSALAANKKLVALY